MKCFFSGEIDKMTFEHIHIVDSLLKTPLQQFHPFHSPASAMLKILSNCSIYGKLQVWYESFSRYICAQFCESVFQ